MTLRAALQIVTAGSTLNLDRVHRYTYVDRTCDLFELTVEVGSDDPAMSIVEPLRGVADFRSNEEAKPFRVRGIVKSVEQLTAEPGGSSRYRVVIVPEAWALTLNRRRRIFQDRNVLETAIVVLSECAATSMVQRARSSWHRAELLASGR